MSSPILDMENINMRLGPSNIPLSKEGTLLSESAPRGTIRVRVLLQNAQHAQHVQNANNTRITRRTRRTRSTAF